MSESLTFKDFVAGTFGGWGQVLAGQPFDIVKVRMASATTRTSLAEVTLSIIQKEGVLAFWKGSLSPLLGVGACVSVQFGVVENVKQKIKERNSGQPLSYPQLALSGSIAGFVNSFISGPVEGFRIRMQVQGKVLARGDPIYTSDLDCIEKVSRIHGLKGIFHGLEITLIRETCCFSTYFVTYEYIINQLKPLNGTVADCKTWQLLLAGGCAGLMYWLPWYPIDAVKSKIQADSLANPRFTSIADCVKQTYKADGVGGFYRGFLPCLLRAFPANSATFVAYEMAMRTMGRD